MIFYKMKFKGVIHMFILLFVLLYSKAGFAQAPPITACFCMPKMTYGFTGVVYLDQNQPDECNHPTGIVGQPLCNPAYTEYSFYHRYQFGFTERDFFVSSPENHRAVEFTKNTSRNDIADGWEYVYRANFFVYKTYVGKFSVTTQVYDQQTTTNLCMLKKTGPTFGQAFLLQGNTVATNGSVNLDFHWKSGMSEYCEEVFYPQVGGQIRLIENGVPQPWKSTVIAANPNGGLAFRGQGMDIDAIGFGNRTYTVQIKDAFGNTYSTPPLTINLVPTCFSEIPLVTITPLDGGLVKEVNGGYAQGNNSFAPGGYELEQGKTYEVKMNAGTIDYCQYYETIVNDGSATPSASSSCTDATCNIQNSLTSDHLTVQPTSEGTYTVQIHDPVGYYAMYGKRKLCLGTNCTDANPLNLMVGGSNRLGGNSPCLITLPDDMPTVFPELSTYAANQAQAFILGNFVYSVTSSQGIIVRSSSSNANYNYGGGIILQDGAVLKIEDVYEQPLPELVDNNKNWTQNWIYDDEGQVISEAKQFYNEQGSPLQTQVKSLSKEMVLAAEPIYDKYGRPVINTLSAPVRYKENTAAVAQCGPNILNGANMYFIYKGDFSSGYNFQKFDTYVGMHYLAAENHSIAYPVDNDHENLPIKLEGTTEKTLAWYYGESNNSAAASPLKEPYVDQSHYPYTRTLFYNDGTSELKGSTIPGNAFKAGGSYVPEQKIKALETSDDVFLSQYHSIYTSHVFPTLTSPISFADFKANLYKVSYKDVEGQETLTYKTKDGQSIASIYVPSSDKTCQFYNSLGQLVCAISPNGMKQLLTDNQAYADIDKSTYRYNTRGWVIEVNELDAGTSKFMYRKDGNIRFSQNAQQLLSNKFSYTSYDKTGRPVESGEFTPSNPNLYFGQADLRALIENTADNDGLTSGTKSDQVITAYDSPDLMDPNAPQGQTFTTGKVSYTVKPGEAKTWYSYDERGRITWTAHYVAGLIALPEKYKTVEYRYDNSGNVLEVAYNRGQTDQFYHVYLYDKDSRLSQVYTALTPVSYSPEKQPELTNLSLQATYQYYNHGPLKRVELGENLQGIDYTYTLQGWLKAINNYHKTQDPGSDNNDVFGMSLDYYSGDYHNKAGQVAMATPTGITAPAHHNGNIMAQHWFTEKPVGATEPTTATSYQYLYDHKNQLINAQFGNINTLSNAISFATAASEGNISYDANGNMLSLKRFSADGSVLHDFTAYNYQGNTNKLTSITGHNESYAYNSIGQLTATTNTNTSTNAFRYQQYNALGLITNVSKDAAGTQPLMQAHYNDNGLRYKKESYDQLTGNLALTTYYVHDAAGNVLAVYSKDNLTPTPQVQEYNVYGSNRIGQYRKDGNQFINVYELQDHLGSVRALVWKNSINDQLEVLSYQDYYPYGLSMRGYEQNYSRYNTYQGEFSERDPETGELKFELRSYNALIGRWFGPDPYQEFYSPYLSMGNNPVSYVDPDGGKVFGGGDPPTGGKADMKHNKIPTSNPAPKVPDMQQPNWSSFFSTIGNNVKSGLEYLDDLPVFREGSSDGAHTAANDPLFNRDGSLGRGGKYLFGTTVVVGGTLTAGYVGVSGIIYHPTVQTTVAGVTSYLSNQVNLSTASLSNTLDGIPKKIEKVNKMYHKIVNNTNPKK